MFMARVRGVLKNPKGFTLIEIAIVVAIIGLLLMIALPLYSGARVRAYVAEARSLGSEWKSLEWACEVEKGFDETKCDTAAEINWTPAQNSGAWVWQTAVMFCGALSPVTATQASSTCGSNITSGAAVVGLRVPRQSGVSGLNNDYTIAIDTIKGTVGESAADGTSFTP